MAKSQQKDGLATEITFSFLKETTAKVKLHRMRSRALLYTVIKRVFSSDLLHDKRF